MNAYELKTEDIWDDDDHSLWKVNIYPECATIKECMEYAELLIQMTTASEVDFAKVEAWKKSKKTAFISALTMLMEVFGGNMRKTEQKLLLESIDRADFSEKLRIYYGMAQM